MTRQNANKNIRKTARQSLIEERRRQVAILITQSFTEVEIAKKLGVDDTTISKDVKALKLISQQFIYDITKSDFTYYYKQCLDTVKLVLRRQWEIIDKDLITKQDMMRAKILSDIMNTVSTINEYYNAAPGLHRSPIRAALEVDNFGVRPGSRIRTFNPTDDDLKAWEVEDLKEVAEEEAELKALEEKYSTATGQTSQSFSSQ